MSAMYEYHKKKIINAAVARTPPFSTNDLKKTGARENFITLYMYIKLLWKDIHLLILKNPSS